MLEIGLKDKLLNSVFSLIVNLIARISKTLQLLRVVQKNNYYGQSLLNHMKAREMDSLLYTLKAQQSRNTYISSKRAKKQSQHSPSHTFE